MPRKPPRHEYEWPVWTRVDEIDEGGLRKTIEAGEEQRAALARRMEVTSIEKLSADLFIEPQAGGIWHVSGQFQARLTQQCVVTLEPIQSDIEEAVEGWFGDKAKMVSFAKARQEKAAQKGHVEVEIVDESEDPEELVDGAIDLGELVAQHLSLAINPYPHKEGVEYELGDDTAKPAGIRRNPFEALKDWKDKK